MRRLAIFFTSIVLIFFLLVANQKITKNFIFQVDWILFKGLFSRSFVLDEPELKKKKIESLKFNFDYSWLEREGFVFIAHRGGNYFYSGQNTKKTIENSIDNSAMFIEVDLDFDQNGKVICVTDNHKNNDACDLQWLINALSEGSFYLIIDPKFNVHDKDLYKRFYEQIFELSSSKDLSCRIIPQAYNFEHLLILNELHDSIGPIFTTYKTNIPNSIIYKLLTKINIKVMTVPLESISFIKNFDKADLSFFVHPINNESDFKISQNQNIKGIYSPIYWDKYNDRLNEKKINSICKDN